MPEQPSKPINLKCENPWFSDVYRGEKDFEVRVDDRGYKVGMLINLLEYDRPKDLYLGRSVAARIKYILRDNRFIPEGKCVFGFERIGSTSERVLVITTVTPSTHKFIEDMAKVNGTTVSKVVSDILDERVVAPGFSFHYNERERAHPP